MGVHVGGNSCGPAVIMKNPLSEDIELRKNPLDIMVASVRLGPFLSLGRLLAGVPGGIAD